MMFRIFAFLILFSGFSVHGKSLKYLLNRDQCPHVYEGVLDLSNLKLTSIEGIDEYPGIDWVNELILRDNNLKSIEPLRTLEKSNIVVLDLAGNKIKNFTALVALPCLRMVNIESTLIDYKNLIFLLLKLRHLTLKVDSDFFGGNEEEVVEFDAKEEQGEVVRKLNVIQLNKLKNLDAQDVCGLCLHGSNLYATACKHKYHKECFNGWVSFCRKNEQATKCPTCRRKLASNFNAILEVVKD